MDFWKLFAVSTTQFIVLLICFILLSSSKLPDEVAFRKKVGFAVPIRKWLADDNFNAPVIEKLFGDTSKKFFEQSALKELWTRYINGEDFLWSRIYALYVFIVWYDLKF